MKLSRISSTNGTKLVAVACSVVALLLTNLTSASAVQPAGILDVSGVKAPDIITFDNLQTWYDSTSDTSSICFTVYGLQIDQTAALTDVSVTVASSTVTGTYSDSQSYSTYGYDDGYGTIVGDLCVTVPTIATYLVEPIDFESMAVAGTLTVDADTGGGDGDGGGTSTEPIGVVQDRFDFSSVMGPVGMIADNPTTFTDPDTGTSSVCMRIVGLSPNEYGYLRNIDMIITTDDFSGEYMDVQSYSVEGIDNGEGVASGSLCIAVDPEAAPYIVDDTFTSISLAGDLFVPYVDIVVDDPATTGVVVESSFSSTYDPETNTTSGCFTLAGFRPEVPIYLTGISIVVTQDGNESTATLDDQLFDMGPDDGDASCLALDSSTDPQIADLGDLQTADGIRLSGTLHFASTISDSFATYMATKGVIVKSIGIVRHRSGAAIVATMRPKAKKSVYLTPSRLKFDGIQLISLERAWVLPVAKNTTFRLAYSTTNFIVDHVNGAVTASVVPLVPSTVRSTAVQLPSGITIAPFDPDSWDYQTVDANTYDPTYADKTAVCLQLQNSTKRAINLNLNWTWKVGATRKSSKGTQYVEVPARGTACVSGVGDPEALFITGDVRFGSIVTVTGTTDVVTATRVRITGVEKPDGYTVSSNAAKYSYDSKTNKTTVSLIVKDTGENNPSNLALYEARINGVAVASATVASNRPNATTGDGNWFLTVGTVRGDVRAKSSITITGAIVESEPTLVDASSVMIGGEDDRTQCQLLDATEWAYDAVEDFTFVRYGCINSQRLAKVVDFSGLALSYSADGLSFDSFETETGTDAVSVAKGTSARSVRTVNVFKVTGDVRTGGAQISITGTLTYQ